MLNAGLNVVRIFAVPGSYLEKELTSRGIAHDVIQDKKFLVEGLLSTDFDIFLSNGLPYILPMEKLQANSTKQFINIHPSYLPDLRGADPVPGALLFGRDSGATCHVMGSTVDGGDIIAQVKINYTEDLDCATLYQLSFKAEKEVFQKALTKNFSGAIAQHSTSDDIYYTFKDADLLIDFSNDGRHIFRQVRAFNTGNKGAYFIYQDQKVKIFDAEIVTNDYLFKVFETASQNQVVLALENKLLVKKTDGFLWLKNIQPSSLRIPANTILGQ